MARIETWLDCDLKKIIRVHEIKGNVFTQDHLGNLIGVRVYDNGEPVTLAGSVNGYCILADGSTVPVDGDRDTSGNRAWIILPQSAYAVPGTIRITIKLTETDGDDVDHIVTLASLVGTVTRSKTDNMVTPSSQVITDWSQEISAEMQEVSDAAAAVAGNFATAYSTTKTYSVGEYVTYNGALYRCTTAVTTAGSWSSNSAKFAAVKMGNDVADLKSAIDETKNIIFSVAKTFALGTLATNGGINPETGVNTVSSAKLTRTPYLAFDVPMLVVVDNNDYEYCAWVYSNQTVSYKLYSPTKQQYTGEPTVIALVNTKDYIRLGFRRVDGADLTTDETSESSDFSKIRAAVHFYQITDKTLSMPGVPADAFEVTNQTLNQIGLTISSANIANYPSVDDFPVNVSVGVISSALQSGLTNYPFKYAGMITTLQSAKKDYTGSAGRIQIAYSYSDMIFAYRSYQSGNWTAWKYIGSNGYIYSRVSTASALVDAIQKSYLDTIPTIILMAAGTYDLSNMIETIASDQTYTKGLVIRPNVILQGAGKDNTIIKCIYTGSDSNIKANVSILNTGYASTLKDFTIIAENMRYPIHDDGTAGYGTIDDLTGAEMFVENIKCIHLGSNNTGYNIPCAFGSGFYGNQKKHFVNCDFIANGYAAWGTHNHLESDLNAFAEFTNCTFYNIKDTMTTGVYPVNSAFRCATWNPNQIVDIKLNNCKMNKPIILDGNSGEYTNKANAFRVQSDGADEWVYISIPSLAVNVVNFVNKDCVMCLYTGDLSDAPVMYQPVSSTDGWRLDAAYNPNALYKGITMSVPTADNPMVSVMTKGRINYRPLIDYTDVGNYIKWNEETKTWAANSTSGELQAVSAGTALIVV